MMSNRKRLYRNSVVVLSDSESEDFIDLTSSPIAVKKQQESQEKGLDHEDLSFGDTVGEIDGALEFETSPTKKRRGSKLFSSKGCQEIFVEEIEQMPIIDAVDFLKRVFHF